MHVLAIIESAVSSLHHFTVTCGKTLPIAPQGGIILS